VIVDSFRNIFAIPDLRKRVLFMFALLGVYRIGCNIPTRVSTRRRCSSSWRR
jgi:preprotein translocase subunit SecY